MVGDKMVWTKWYYHKVINYTEYMLVSFQIILLKIILDIRLYGLALSSLSLVVGIACVGVS